MKGKLKIVIHVILFSGILVFAIGLYFMFIKAGLPYQDPTTEMTVKWMAYYAAGEVCVRYGMGLFVPGLAGEIAGKFIK